MSIGSGQMGKRRSGRRTEGNKVRSRDELQEEDETAFSALLFGRTGWDCLSGDSDVLSAFGDHWLRARAGTTTMRRSSGRWRMGKNVSGQYGRLRLPVQVKTSSPVTASQMIAV